MSSEQDEREGDEQGGAQGEPPIESGRLLSTGRRDAMGLSVAGSTRFRPKGDSEGRGYHESVSQLTPEERGELAYYAGYEPPEPVRHEPRFRILRKLATPFVLLGALLLKFKFIFLAIFKFKIFTTSATMLVSVAAYTLIWGWKFAVGFVAPHVRPRDGPRARGEAAGHPGQRADLHPLPRRGDHR